MCIRDSSNSERLADEFVRGVQESENYAEHISLRDKTIHFCKGCLTCQESQRCVIHDDADMIVQKMRTADVIVFATPIYYYEMSGQMKTLLDRDVYKRQVEGVSCKICPIRASCIGNRNWWSGYWAASTR